MFGLFGRATRHVACMLLDRRHSTSRRRLRSALRGNLIVPPTGTAATVHNVERLPAPLRNDELPVTSYRHQLKT